MTDHRAHTVERRCDVAIIGGSAAGLAAALQLARQRRSVIVVDAGQPRNAPAAHMHSYLGHEGVPPAQFAALARDEVRQYGVEVIAGAVTDVDRDDDGRFRIVLAGGHAILARRVLAATGLVDELPDIEGLAAHWGGDVIHCPFCHGYEVRDARIVQIVTHPMGLHPAGLFRQLTERFTLVLHGGVDGADAGVQALLAAGVRIVDGPVERIVNARDGRLRGVQLADGTLVDADAVAIGSPFRVRIEPFARLGLESVEHASGLGDVVETDAMGQTSVPGLYAAGNLTDPSQQVLQAAANGSRVGGMISLALAAEDIEAAARPSGNEADWDHRYSRDQLWSGNPNGSMVQEVQHLAPGRALDVGAGEGGDAVWLAQRGWRVTANDISQRALERVAAAADQHGVSIELRRADANALDAFGDSGFDLVSAQYASIPRTPDDRGVRNLIGAVAPGGTLLVVGHDLEPLRAPADGHQHARSFDPDAYVSVDHVAASLAELPEWQIEVHEKHPRPPGAASAAHHVDDIILRARRRA